ncbi:hypothetical protein BACPLE_03271 [Phocaeicola plebeius DSM 17135]|uniref:Uncharacterized protein n=1 Tax=Phocaeicola plebeius (strain DSM 17135 / JCM 12973 / CCUG 54634 / M2) TaxID=484018 RepID=B5D2N1_PHOPM|nr:hypothetical protein BACPLE_03271 [Phocaeicola plebeius DSM 17135]
MLLLFFYARKSTWKNAFVFHFKRKYILLKTQVHLIPNVRTFSFKRKCVFRWHKNEPTFE